MDDEVKSTGDANTKLASWKEELCSIMSHDSNGEGGGGQASKGGTNSEGPDLVKVAMVFVQGEQVVATERRMACFGCVTIYAA